MTNGSLMKVKSIAEYTAILLTCIKRQLVLKTNFWYFSEWSFYTGLNVYCYPYRCIGKYVKVRKTVRIRNRYNKVPHLPQDTKWESNKIKINITNKSQEVNPFPSR